MKHLKTLKAAVMNKRFVSGLVTGIVVMVVSKAVASRASQLEQEDVSE